MPTDDLESYSERLSYLVKIGCKPYELAEYPQILQLNKNEVDDRVCKLKDHGVTSVSMPLLRLLEPPRSNPAIAKRIEWYMLRTNERLNYSDEIVDALRCSCDEMVDILTQNPRLVGELQRKFMKEKIECLLNYGARLEDIRSNTSLLNNKTLETIESRARLLSAIGCNDPLLIGIIGRTKREFQLIVDRLVGEKELRSEIKFPESNVIMKELMPHLQNHRYHVVKAKVNLLLSHGYTMEDILAFPTILDRVGLANIHSSITYINQLGVGLASLETCYRYALKKHLPFRRMSLRRTFSKLLDCSSDSLPTMPSDFGAAAPDEAAMLRNYGVLRECGFLKDDIIALPIILLHHADDLQACWRELESDNAVAFARFKGDTKKLLNLLQYTIEKSSNFRQTSSSIRTNSERSDNELGPVESSEGALPEGGELRLEDEDDDEGVPVADNLSTEEIMNINDLTIEYSPDGEDSVDLDARTMSLNSSGIGTKNRTKRKTVP